MKIKGILAAALAAAISLTGIPVTTAGGAAPAAEIRAEGLNEFEAENYAQIFDSYIITDDVAGNDALAGFSNKFVYIPASASPNLAITPPNDRAPGVEFHIDVKDEGIYNIWTYVWTRDSGAQTQYIRIDNGAYSMVQFAIDETKPRGGWSWQMIGSAHMTKGRHTIGVTQRHRFVGFDKFIITTTPDFSPDGKPLSTPEFLPSYGDSAEYYYNLPPIVPPENQHPRVLMNSSMIPEIRKNLTHEQNRETYELLCSKAEYDTDGKFPPMNDTAGTNISLSVLDTMQANAFLYAVNGDVQAGKKAVLIAKNAVETGQGRTGAGDELTRIGGHLMFSAAIVYDWCYDLMTDEERRVMRSYIYRMASFMEVGYPTVKHKGNLLGHNVEMQIWKDLFSIAIAIYDEDPKMYNHIAGRMFDDMIPIRNYLNRSTVFNEGVNYGPFRFACELFATYLFRGMGYDNVFEKQQHYALYGMFYRRRPDGRLFNTGDNSFEGNYGFAQDSAQAYFMAGNFYKDPLLKRDYYRKVKDGTSASSDASGVNCVLHLIMNDTSVPVNASYEQLPLTTYSNDILGTMLARTSWEEGKGSDAVAVQMNTHGYFYGGHSHADAGHFDIYYKGNLALDSGVYEGTPFIDQAGNYVGSNIGHGGKHYRAYSSQSIAHNTMLVDDPSEEYYDVYNKISYNSKGQKDAAAAGANYENLEEYKIGTVQGWDYGPDLHKPAYSYLKGDIAGAYSDKVTDYTRSFMFLNLFDEDYPAALIVLDNITSSNEAFKKTWLLHTQEEPTVEGNVTTVARTAFGNNGRLVNETLYPLAPEIEKVGGEGKEFYYDGWNYGAGLKSIVQEAGVWRVEISPSKPSKQDYFLNVIQVSENDESIEPLKSELIRDDDEYFGLKIKDRAVFMKKDSSLLIKDMTVAASGEGEIMYIADGLREGKWTVNDSNGRTVAECLVEKGHNVASFTATAGEYNMHWDYTADIPAKDYSLAGNIAPQTTHVIDVMIDNVYESFKNEICVRDGAVYLPAEELFAKLGKEYTEENGIFTLKSKKGEELPTASVEINGRKYVSVDELGSALGYTCNRDTIADIVRIETGESIVDKLKLFNSSDPDRITVFDVTASESVGSSPFDTVDNNIGSYWAAQGDGQWIMYEFEEESEISHIDIKWHQGHLRAETFEMYLSSDGENWTEVFRGRSSGNSNTFERCDINADGKYKFVKIVGHGNTLNQWNSLGEIRFYNNYGAQE